MYVSTQVDLLSHRCTGIDTHAHLHAYSTDIKNKGERQRWEGAPVHWAKYTLELFLLGVGVWVEGQG